MSQEANRSIVDTRSKFLSAVLACRHAIGQEFILEDFQLYVIHAVNLRNQTAEGQHCSISGFRNPNSSSAVKFGLYGVAHAIILLAFTGSQLEDSSYCVFQHDRRSLWNDFWITLARIALVTKTHAGLLIVLVGVFVCALWAINVPKTTAYPHHRVVSHGCLFYRRVR